MPYEEYKAECYRIMREDRKFPEHIITELATEDSLRFGYENGVTPEDMVWALVF